MNKNDLKFTYEEQDILCEKGYSEQLARAVIMLDEKLTQKDIRFIKELHKLAQQLLDKENEPEENEL